MAVISNSLKTLKPIRTTDVCAECPNSQLEAQQKLHFGRAAWEFCCEYATELHVTNKGIVVQCSARNGNTCCVDNNRDIIVNSQEIFPLRAFFEATLKYLRLK